MVAHREVSERPLHSRRWRIRTLELRRRRPYRDLPVERDETARDDEHDDDDDDRQDHVCLSITRTGLVGVDGLPVEEALVTGRKLAAAERIQSHVLERLGLTATDPRPAIPA